LELASKVSTKEPYFVGDENADLKIAALDIGIKKNIIRNFVKRGAFVKVFPYDSSFEDLAFMESRWLFYFQWTRRSRTT